MTRLLIRNVSMRRLLDNLFVSAVATVLVIRAFLFLTGWPIIGGETLHIAHMLWGGFFMLAAIILLLAFLGHKVQYWAAILGGVGFGFFIDELGKFITQDNNYFFQPTFMLMYLIFIGLYFIIRELERNTELTEVERLVNALDLSQEAVMKHVDEEDRKKLLSLVEVSTEHESLFAQLRLVIQETVVTPESVWLRMKMQAKGAYFRFVQSKYFIPSIVLLWVVQGGLLAYSFHSFWIDKNSSTIEQIIVVLGVGFAVIAGSYILRGIVELGNSRALAYQKFYRGNLISILLMQPFALYVATFPPIVALGINLLVLFGLQYLLSLEKRQS
jgi:hypothetical protein